MRRGSVWLLGPASTSTGITPLLGSATALPGSRVRSASLGEVWTTAAAIVLIGGALLWGRYRRLADQARRGRAAARRRPSVSAGPGDQADLPGAALPAVREAIQRVADGCDGSLVLRSGADHRRWVQVTRVPGETSLLCEAVGSDYLGWRRRLPAAAGPVLRSLGWDLVSDSYSQWADVATTDERDQLTAVLTATLVGVFGHDRQQPPSVGPP